MNLSPHKLPCAYFLSLGILIVTIGYANLFGQGCSDAGICSVQGYTTESEKQDSGFTPSFFRFSAGYALGEKFTHQLFLQPELVIGIVKGTQVILRAPYQINTGKAGFTYDFGDPMVLISHQLHLNQDCAISGLAGIRFPANRAAKNSLPMPYQTSLGTIDGLLSFEIQYKSWSIRTGYQRVLKHQNENAYLAPFENLGDDPVFFSSRRLRRGNDWMLRADYGFNFTKWRFTPGALMVWRLRKDQYLTEQGLMMSYPLSSGPTFNIVLQGFIPIGQKWFIEPLLASPILAREERPDGLTRNLVASMTIIRRLK
jgi:hypothetical protein